MSEAKANRVADDDEEQVESVLNRPLDDDERVPAEALVSLMMSL